MAIPKFRYIILPFLKQLADKKEHTLKEIEVSLATEFKLTEDEITQRTPSGRMSIFSNRAGWAKTYLKKAGLVDVPKKSYIKITKQGLRVLEQKPEVIDTHFLDQFSSFREFQYGNEYQEAQGKEDVSENTPEESLESSYQKILKDLEADLLTNLKNCSPAFFEQMVVDLLIGMGYGGSRKDAGQALGKTGDEGIDGIIKEDKLGLDLVYLQAKRWKGTVGRPEVQSFVGALNGKLAKKGIFITTSSFTQETLDYVKKLDCKVILVDGSELVGLMIEHNIGVSILATYQIKKVDSDYFFED
ncbi:MAG: restriction endonuclease [Candidatus Pacebacteria bacterium]|nr:restriction endonuclease [Candidatus Paceibacterota bacterium]